MRRHPEKQVVNTFLLCYWPLGISVPFVCGSLEQDTVFGAVYHGRFCVMVLAVEDLIFFFLFWVGYFVLHGHLLIYVWNDTKHF